MIFLVRWWYTTVMTMITMLVTATTDHVGERRREPPTKTLEDIQIEYAVERARLATTMDAAQKMFADERQQLTIAIDTAHRMFIEERERLAEAVDMAQQKLIVERDRIMTLRTAMDT